MIADQTGPLSFPGVANANVAKMVVNDINAKGSLLGRQINLILEDGATIDSVAEAKSAKLVHHGRRPSAASTAHKRRSRPRAMRKAALQMERRLSLSMSAPGLARSKRSERGALLRGCGKRRTYPQRQTMLRSPPSAAARPRQAFWSVAKRSRRPQAAPIISPRRVLPRARASRCAKCQSGKRVYVI
jgi:hypothetical protein